MKSKDRVSHQTARVGWKPKRTSDAKLARDIAHSIMAHAEVGTIRTAIHYTGREEVIEMINMILAKGA